SKLRITALYRRSDVSARGRSAAWRRAGNSRAVATQGSLPSRRFGELAALAGGPPPRKAAAPGPLRVRFVGRRAAVARRAARTPGRRVQARVLRPRGAPAMGPRQSTGRD